MNNGEADNAFFTREFEPNSVQIPTRKLNFSEGFWGYHDNDRTLRREKNTNIVSTALEYYFLYKACNAAINEKNFSKCAVNAMSYYTIPRDVEKKYGKQIRKITGVTK